VVHWNTIANISEWLHPYTANFAKNCMSYRHLRFFRSAKDNTVNANHTKDHSHKGSFTHTHTHTHSHINTHTHKHTHTTQVWLQATARMNSWGDSTDEWRGLAALSTHTVCFKTSYGIPNLWKAFKDGAIPDAQRRELNEEEHAKVVEGMHTIHSNFKNFTDENLKDCLAMLDMYDGAAVPFDWKEEDIQLLYGKGSGAGANEVVAHQQARGLPVGSVGELYLCRPEVGEGEDDTFIIGIIRGITQEDGHNGVNMQWFQLSELAQGNKYQGMYKSVLPATTRCDFFLCCAFSTQITTFINIHSQSQRIPLRVR
jgi:hypothetical protein